MDAICIANYGGDWRSGNVDCRDLYQGHGHFDGMDYEDSGKLHITRTARHRADEVYSQLGMQSSRSTPSTILHALPRRGHP